jgi:acetyltransferase-like isoleucine patch superfamily enzyme
VEVKKERVAAVIGSAGRRAAGWRGSVYHYLLPESVSGGCRIGRGSFLDGLERIVLAPEVKLGDGVGIVARKPGCVSIGRKTFVNAGSVIESSGPGVTIGDDVLIGPHVTIVDQNHAFADPCRPIARQGKTAGGPVVVGDGSWLAAGAVLIGPTTLAPGSVVGANSVVKGVFPRRCVIAGAPARVVRYLDEEAIEHEERRA